MDKKTLNSVLKSKQMQTLIDSGLRIVSTPRQQANGTIALTGKIGRGKKAFSPTYTITATGAVMSNEFVARRVSGKNQIDLYKQGLSAAQELLEKRRMR